MEGAACGDVGYSSPAEVLAMQLTWAVAGQLMLTMASQECDWTDSDPNPNEPTASCQ